jgi:L-alanine-DL-glutamate epimerase-like enolase superfamily enzyme
MAARRDTPVSRRKALKLAATAPIAASLGPWFVDGPRPTDIRIEEITPEYEEFLYRAPYQFGGRSVDRVTLLNVRCRVRTVSGRVAHGFGSMSLGNVWAFPSKVMPYETTLGAMKALAQRIARITGDYREPGHPIDINTALEPAYLEAALAVGRELRLASPIPKLCTLVTASPFDAALHDAFGKVHGRSAYLTYGPDLLHHDLAHYLGKGFEGLRLSSYVRPQPAARINLFHSVGAGDAILPSEVRKPIHDGLPEALGDWLRFNGVTHVKIKLNGSDLDGDLERTVAIDRVTTEVETERRISRWAYCLDFNENCPTVEWLLSYLNRLKERTPGGFERILYIEQPTARDLRSDRANVMHRASALRPVVIDESLTDYETLMLSREMGYTGAALKACKGQSQAMLMAAAGLKHKMFLCVQDLTCPGAALIHSASVAARVPGVSGIEANARQYVPAANKPWESRYPGIFRITDGTLDTSGLTRPGLGAVD